MATAVNKPPDVIIKADNWFHLGWLHAVLGLEKWHFDSMDYLVADENCEAYIDGYQMAMESGFDIITGVVKAMTERGQLKITPGFPYQRKR